MTSAGIGKIAAKLEAHTAASDALLSGTISGSSLLLLTPSAAQCLLTGMAA